MADPAGAVLGYARVALANWIARQQAAPPAQAPRFATQEDVRRAADEVRRRAHENARRAQAEAAAHAREVQMELWARGVLGFDPSETLTAPAIKARKRELSMANHPDHHPDRKGTPGVMARINRAADVLMARVTG